MALVLCTECRKPVSTDATLCPHCGKPNPQPQAKPKVDTGSVETFLPKALPYVLLAAVATVGVVGLISRCESTVQQRQAAADSLVRKRADSVTVDRLLASADRSLHQTIVLDQLLHRYPRPQHASTHPIAVDATLDSVSRLLGRRPRGLDAVNEARRILAQLAELVSPRQESRFRQLQSLERAARVEELRRAERAAAEARRQLERATVENRRRFAEALERTYLSQGMDITVRATGTNATTLRLTWILVSRPLAYQMSESTELFSSLRSQGFRRLEISDGYDHMWYWRL